jgi:hypothetical protein
VTVNELTQKLQTFAGDLRVVTRGFDESGFEDVEAVRSVRIKFHDELAKFHGGRHKQAAENGTPAVFIDWQ